ncbi:MAG: bifunctional glutamate N-acetyltransferase/amino-acid acetyltransferase ArgJ [Leptospira sp.]|nr:bifunctional glutamate N-acetyltransferase/amino-acid acetyltransferase ArgJ [Leptospira sp.]
MEYPQGIHSFGINIGIKDDTPDFALIYSEVVCQAAAVFTRNNYPGAPVIVGREHIRDGKLQAIVINSKNSNVATGAKGVEDSRAICRAIGKSLNIEPGLVLPSSTGVIGVPLPIDKILNACEISQSKLRPGNLEEVAEAIMTTDTRKKISKRMIQRNGKEGMIYGIAKGAGMIEPNMATMLAYIISDFHTEGDLQADLKSVVDDSFNCISIDSDTSTSDTVVVMTNGLSGSLPSDEFRKILLEISTDLSKMIARDGEGATKLIILEIDKARDSLQANKIGKSIINSPLVKTAIYGGDPNWGRLVMAIGKVFDEPIAYDDLEIYFGDLPVKNADQATKTKLSEYLKTNEEIHILCKLGQGSHKKTFYGCDLTEKYVEENAYYTT